MCVGGRGGLTLKHNVDFEMLSPLNKRDKTIIPGLLFIGENDPTLHTFSIIKSVIIQ